MGDAYMQEAVRVTQVSISAISIFNFPRTAGLRVQTLVLVMATRRFMTQLVLSAKNDAHPGRNTTHLRIID